jgi:hypothetical protein
VSDGTRTRDRLDHNQGLGLSQISPQCRLGSGIGAGRLRFDAAHIPVDTARFPTVSDPIPIRGSTLLGGLRFTCTSTQARRSRRPASPAGDHHRTGERPRSLTLRCGHGRPELLRPASRLPSRLPTGAHELVKAPLVLRLAVARERSHCLCDASAGLLCPSGHSGLRSGLFEGSRLARYVLAGRRSTSARTEVGPGLRW